MENTEYLQDGVERVIGLLKDAFGDYFKVYYNGQIDIDQLDENLTPAVIVSATDGTIVAGATGTDDITETIVVAVVLNKKNDLGSQDDQSRKLTEYKLRKLVMGQNPASSEWMDNSIVGVLRKYISLQDMSIETEMTFDFDVARLANGSYFQTGFISLTILRQALVLLRY